MSTKIRTAYLVRLSRDDLKTPGGIEEKFALRLAMCDELADRYGLPLAEEADRYVEQVSGGSLAKRPKMLDCLEKCRTRYYTHLISPYQDRLLRGDKRDEADIEDALIDGNITLITFEGITAFDEAYDSSHALTFEVKAAAARHYLRDIINKMKQSNRQRASVGQKSAGFAPYGYVWVKAQYQNRQILTPGHYEIIGDLELTDETAARTWSAEHALQCLAGEAFDANAYITLARSQSLSGGSILPGVACTGGEYFHVLEIFRRIRNEGYKSILTDFNQRGVPTPSALRYAQHEGHLWHVSTLRSLIANYHYSGFPTHRETTDRQRRKIEIAREQWIMPDSELPYPHPLRLPEQEALLEKITQRGARGAARPSSPSLLTGLVHCSQGKPMSSNVATYHCTCRYNNNSHIGEHIRFALIEEIVEFLLEQIINAVPPKRSQRQRIETEGSDPSDLQIQLQQQLKTKRRELDDLRSHRDLFVRIGNADAMQSAVDKVTADIAELETQQKAAQTSQQSRAAVRALATLREIKSAGFRSVWEYFTKAEQRDILHLVFERISLTQVERKGQRNSSVTFTVKEWIQPFFASQTVRIRLRRNKPNEYIIE